jgi:hypothetical protein
MTRRIWATIDGYEVATGWDRMLQEFFCDIGTECKGCDSEECNGTHYVFNNLDAKEYTNQMGGMTLSGVETVLDKYLTEHPPTIIGDLYGDCDNNVGNLVKDYGVVGKVK